MWGMGGVDGGWGPMGFGTIGMTLFGILLVVAIVALVKGLWGGGASPGQRREKDALDILSERYARGEIEKQEFDRKKHDLAA